MTTTLFADSYERKPVTLLKDAHIEAISLVDKGANGHRFILFKRAEHYVDESGNVNVEGPDTHSVEKQLPLIKGGTSTEPWKVAYSVVAVPQEVDIQKDVWTEDEIRKAAHDFLKANKPLINFMHKDLNSVGDLVESAIALDDIKIGDNVIKKGSWYIGIEPHAEVRKAIESGTITGVSVQGSSRRVPVDGEVVDGKGDARPVLKSDGSPMGAPARERDENSFDYRHIPMGAEGPGIKKLQKMLGIPDHGVYDEDTEDAYMLHLDKMHPGEESEPTIENLKKCLYKCASMVPGEQQPYTAAEVPVLPVPQASPVQPVGKVTPPHNPIGPSADGYDPAYGVSSATGSGTTVEQIGSEAGSLGTQRSGLDPNSSTEDLKIAIYQAFKEGDKDLSAYLRDMLRINSPERFLYAPINHEMLWYMYSKFVMGAGKHVDNSPHNAGEPVTHQPTPTPAHIMPEGSGQAMSKMVPNAASMTDKQKYEYLWGAGNVAKCDLCKDGMLCDHHNEALMKGAMFDVTSHPVAVFTDKNGVKTHVGEPVKNKDQIWEVSSIAMDGSMATSVSVVRIDAEGNEVVKEFKPDDLEALMGNEAVEKGVLPASSGGSMGGHDPRANGKIRFIVRSFGKWAGGKHRICVARMKSEHPEVFKGNEDAGCAWLKDQYLHTTKWRNQHKKFAKGESAFTAIMNTSLVKGEDILTPEGADALFTRICEDLGLDHEVVTSQMGDGFDNYLDELFHHEEGDGMGDVLDNENSIHPDLDEHEAGFVAKVVNYFISKKVEKNLPMQAPEDAGEEVSKDDIASAVSALHVALEDAMGVNVSERPADLENILEDFGSWVREHLSNGELSDDSAKAEEDQTQAPTAPMAPSEAPEAPMQKGWMPADVTEGDLEDGDFAWVSDDKSLPDSERRKLPYKIHGKVNEAGWRAAWSMAAMADLTGGPSLDEVKNKLLSDKPESVTVSENTMSKSTETDTSRERLIAEAGAFLNELVETNEEELEKDAEVEAEATNEPSLTIDEVALFADRLADRMDAFEQTIGSLHKSLGEKLDTVGELAKSLDLTDRITALEEAINSLKEEAAAADQVEEVAKRVTAIEQQPGHSTQVEEERVEVAKSAPAPLFTRSGGRSIF